MQIAIVLALGLISLLLSCIIPGVWWNMFILGPLIIVPIPWVLFGQDSLDGGGAWKSFSEFFSGFLFSTSWAIILILYHLGSTDGVGLALGLVANLLVLASIVLYFYHQSEDSFGNNFM